MMKLIKKISTLVVLVLVLTSATIYAAKKASYAGFTGCPNVDVNGNLVDNGANNADVEVRINLKNGKSTLVSRALVNNASNSRQRYVNPSLASFANLLGDVATITAIPNFNANVKIGRVVYVVKKNGIATLNADAKVNKAVL